MIVTTVNGMSVAISPEHIQEGDTITITISNLPDESKFALRMESAIKPNQVSNSFYYQLNQLTLPFALHTPRISLSAESVTEAGLEVSDGDTIKRMTQRTQTGEVRIIQTLDTIPAGTIDILKTFGKPIDGSEYVDISLELSGTKKGPDTGLITFDLKGIRDGSTRIIILVDGTEAKNILITIGTGTHPPSPTLVAAFTATPLTGTVPLTVDFTDRSSNNPTSWNWEYNIDGTWTQFSTSKNPSHTFTNTGIYSIRLTSANNNESNTSTKTGYITVTSPPMIAAFIASPTTGNAPLTVQFTDQSTGSPFSWNWDFGDGVTSREQHPTHTYTTGTYSVRLTVTSDVGNVNTVTKTGYIAVMAPPAPAPVAAFTATPTIGTAPLTVQFTDQSTNNPTSWVWRHRTGETWTRFSTMHNPSYTFKTPGTYWIELMVTNEEGYRGIERKLDYITVKNPMPSEEYEFVMEWGAEGKGDGQFYQPFDIVVDSTGYVYIADTFNHRIQKFTSGGTFITEWGTKGSDDGQFDLPFGVTVDSAGHVYVADLMNHRIQKFTSTGTFITTWGIEGTGDGQLKYPFGVAADTAGNIYVVDSEPPRIQKFTNNGAFITKWGTEGSGNGEFRSPTGIVVDGVGNVYVADTGNNRIQKFNSGGTFITTWGGPGLGNAQFSLPHGVSVDVNGNVYVADTWNKRIQKFTSEGNFVATWGSSGTGNGQFVQPFGVAVDAKGYVYVADTSNHRIQKFSLVTPPPPTLPEAGFTVSPTTGTAPLTVQFTDQSTNIPTSWRWEYSTGGAWTLFSTSKNSSYEFTTSGTYSIRLTVANDGGSDTATKTGYITVTSPSPTAVFTANPISGPAPHTVQFTDTSAGIPSSWEWDFGDGSSSPEQNPVHTYTSSGTYSVILIASNAGGNDTVTEQDLITVHIRGDFNGNGRVDIGDVSRVAHMAIRLIDPDPAADFTGDGEVDAADAARIAYYYVGNIPAL